MPSAPPQARPDPIAEATNKPSHSTQSTLEKAPWRGVRLAHDHDHHGISRSSGGSCLQLGPSGSTVEDIVAPYEANSVNHRCGSRPRGAALEQPRGVNHTLEIARFQLVFGPFQA